MRYPIGSALSLTLAYACAAHAAVEVRFDSSGFFQAGDGRELSSSAITIRPEAEASGGGLIGKVDVQFSAFLNDPNSYAWEVRDTYVTTSRENFPLHQLTVGRRHYEWLKLDEVWQVGVLTPRYQWDPLHPESLGLSGLFYEYKHKAFRVLAFGSPISIPEHGAPVEVRDNRLYSASPLWKPPLATLPVMNQDLPAYYRLDYPSTEELTLHPGAAVSFRFQNETGPEASLTFASLPIHQPDLVTDSELLPQGIVETRVRPRILRHELATLELGYREPETRIWASYTAEFPDSQSNTEREISRAVGPTAIVAAGLDLFQKSRFRLSAAYLSIRENKIDPPQASLLPSRFNFSHATRLSADFRPTPRWIAAARWTHDLEWNGDLISADIAYRPWLRSFDQKDIGWIFGVGMDLTSSTPNGGFIGQFESDDRFRGRISYAF